MSKGETALKLRDQDLLSLAEQVISQSHYEMIEQMDMKPLEADVSCIDPGSVACLFKIPELVYSREEDLSQRLSTILNALHTCGASCLMLLECRQGRSELYLGAVNKQKYENIYYRNTVRDILRTGIEGNLPGTELEELIRKADIDEKIRDCLDNGYDSQCITAVSCMGSEGEHSRGNVSHGLESLLGAVGKKNFTIMVLADPVSKEQVEQVKLGYEQLDSQLSVMERVTVSRQEGSSFSESENVSGSIGESIGHSISLTQSHAESTGWNRGGSQTNPGAGNKLGTGLAVATGLAAMASGAGTAAYFAMNAVSSLTQMVFPQQNSSEGVSGGSQDTESHGTQDSRTYSVSWQQGHGKTRSATRGTSLQFTGRSRHVQELCAKLDWYLKWLNRCENQGMFNCSAYVVSASASINMLVASQYQAMIQGDADVGLPVSLNTWTRQNGVEQVREYLMHLMHPVFEEKHVDGMFSPAMLVSSGELSRQLALPRRSVVGISVMEYASFGQEVVRKSRLAPGTVAQIGVISHMGKANPSQPVYLDIQSLAAHTFVAGTNGSGKSNMIFRLLEELMRSRIPFLVIEPAKGEYKNVFGADASQNVKVYGTNRRKTALMRLNPFWFNEDVDVREHIDKLIEVFNASWPMYAAMPAVLKAAVENAYRGCGWDLGRSVCRGGYRIFPTVKDVLGELGKKMDSTAFSQEVKGNYEGALSTRLESLCNGIYRDIFSGANLSDEELFEQNVIVDLSRVGSAETKAMIMGMLVIRLQEYRMKAEAMNLPLQHVTVLEEAHNLLRRTSAVQTEDGANLLGKSVEMIANSIAEMRSYGEGFIIADQSPGLLDISVIRNTNTKIILRLPEAGDRELAGTTMGLTPKQIYEISRLKTGVCAVYQKDWLEAVLCQIDRAAHSEQVYRHVPEEDTEQRRSRRLACRLLDLAAGEENAGLSAADDGLLIEQILACGMEGYQKRALLQNLQSGRPDRELYARAAVWLLPVEFPGSVPEDADAWKEEMQAGIRDICSLEEPYAGRLLDAAVGMKAKEQPEWEEVCCRIRGGEQVNEPLKYARGRAFTVLCPIGPQTDGDRPSAALLEKDLGILAASGYSDRLLGKQLQSYLQGGQARAPKSSLTPYAEIVWNLLDGDRIWGETCAYVETKQYQKWDQVIRGRVSEKMECGIQTQTAVMSLFLQRMGSLPEVRRFYTPWYNFSRLQNRPQEEPGSAESGN